MQYKILQIINVTRFNFLRSVAEDTYIYTYTHIYGIHATNPICMHLYMQK